MFLFLVPFLLVVSSRATWRSKAEPPTPPPQSGARVSFSMALGRKTLTCSFLWSWMRPQSLYTKADSLNEAVVAEDNDDHRHHHLVIYSLFVCSRQSLCKSHLVNGLTCVAREKTLLMSEMLKISLDRYKLKISLSIRSRSVDQSSQTKMKSLGLGLSIRKSPRVVEPVRNG